MNTKKTFALLKIMIVAVVLSVGLSYAGTWTAPGGAAPTGNIDVPINRSANFQEKKGGLSVNTFAALGDAELKQQAFFRGPVKGIDTGSSNPTLEIGGISTNGTGKRVVTTVNGDWMSGQTIGSTELINGTLQPLCSEDTGRVVLCGQGGGTPTPPVPPTIYASCFIADTMVTLADGSKKKIQDVQIGDTLKGDTTDNKVLAFHQPELGDNQLYAFNGGEYFVTAEHPFMTTKGWKSIDPEKTMKEHIGITVSELRVGDVLVTSEGLVRLEMIDGKDAPQDTKLYNFILDGDHTYYADDYLVHNKTLCGSGSPGGSCGVGSVCIPPTTPSGQAQPGAGSCSLVCNPSQPSTWPTSSCGRGTTTVCTSSGVLMCQ